MRWFKNLKISVKLLLAFLIIALIAGFVGIFGIVSLSDMSSNNRTLFANHGDSQGYLGYVYGIYQEQRSLYRDVVIDQDADAAAETQQTATESDKELMSYLSKYKETCTTEDDIAMYNDLEEKIEAFREVRDQIIAFGAAGDFDGANELLKADSSTAIITEATTAIDEAVASNVEKAEERQLEEEESVSRTIVIMTILVAVAVSLAVVLGFFISRIISKPIRHISEVANMLAAGDTDVHRTDYESKDEVGELFNSFRAILASIQALVADANMLSEAAVQGQLTVRADADKHQGDYKKIITGVNDTLNAVVAPINEATGVLKEVAKGNLSTNMMGNYIGDHAVIKKALNESISSMNRVLSGINTASEQVATGTMQVSNGSQEISEGASEQAGSIEELTVSITQISDQTRKNAENAERANKLSLMAKDSAVDGNERMKAMQAAMQEINESSENISKIIKVIDDIAFQTNILALNAAVEAARAGIHGKGFAVVAEEVRNLAARSANAAKETTDLIEGSIQKVEAGTKISDETAKALESIVEGVEKAVQLVNGITVASNEQATGITQVNKGIEQLSQVVQTNSSSAEETAAAAEELSSQAQALKDMVAEFKLSNSVASGNLVSVKDNADASVEEMKNNLHIKLDDGEFGKY